MVKIKARNSLLSVSSIVLLALTLGSCDKTRLFEANKDFTEKKWFEDSVCTFKFEVIEINQPYTILYNVRNTLNYSYHNLFVKYRLIGPDGTELRSELQELQLMDAKTGAPFGSGFGDIFDNRIYAFKNYNFPKTGTYTLIVKQYMRKNPIEEILAFGIRIEKSTSEN